MTLDERRAVTLRADAACGRYLGRVIRGVNQAAPTPDWMKIRLARAGLRLISAIVDVTTTSCWNKASRCTPLIWPACPGGIVVRMAEQGETLTLLNGKEQALDADMLVIADEHKAVALAGVGWAAPIEAATAPRMCFWNPPTLPRKRLPGARRLGFLLRRPRSATSAAGLHPASRSHGGAPPR